MKRLALGLLVLLTAKLYSLPAISPKEAQFWKDFDSSKPSTLINYINSGFISGNYWFRDNPLIIAISNRNYDTADALIKANIRQKIEIDDRKDRDILYYIIENDDTEGMIYLLKNRGSIEDTLLLYIIGNNKSKELFRNAIVFAKSIDANILIENSGGMDSPSSYKISTLLLECIEKNKEELVNELLELKVDVNALGYSFQNGQLMYASIKPDIYTPLDQAIKKNNARIIDLLISHGAEKFDDVLADNKELVDNIVIELSKKAGSQLITNQAIELKELPRKKSFCIRKLQKETKVILLKQSEIISIGDSKNCWYFVKVDSLYGWINSRFLDNRYK